MKKMHRALFISAVFSLISLGAVSFLHAQDRELQWTNFEEALKIADEQNKPILVDVWAPWCGWCKKMQKEVYPGLTLKLESDFILTRLNRDDNESRLRYKQIKATPFRLAQNFNVQEVPALVFLSPQGEYLFHVTGFTEEETLRSVLQYAEKMVSEKLATQTVN